MTRVLRTRWETPGRYRHARSKKVLEQQTGLVEGGYEMNGHGVGVGQINRSDSKMRRSLHENLLYLAKAE